MLPAVGWAQASGTDALPVSNGFAAAAWSPSRARLTAFYPHLYQQWSAVSPPTPQLAFDAYLGVRLGGAAVWLPEAASGPGLAGYGQGGMVRARQTFGGATVDTWLFAPQDLAAPVVLIAGHVLNTGTATLSDNALFSLHNFHLGLFGGATGETTRYDTARSAFIETGPTGALAYVALSAPTRFARSPENPYPQLKALGQLASGGAGPETQDDSVSGFEWALPTLAPGAEAWGGVAILSLPAGDDATAGAAIDALRAWVAGRGAAELVADGGTEWAAWLAKATRPAGLTADEQAVLDVQLAVLRMAQVKEPNGAGGVPHGQIVASMPPGQWNIAWTRDMAYAVMALSAYGYFDEARAALDFTAASAPRQGLYQSEVGSSYGVSVCRYFGNGDEWSDVDADGPNVELDGFGLYLIAAKRAGVTVEPSMLDKTATVLENALGSGGLVKADSSIWERHLNGNERHFAYTSLTAAAGLEAAGRHDAARLVAAAVARLVDSDGALCASAEACPTGSQRHDGSVIEAWNFGVLADTVAPGTKVALAQSLKLASGGYKRIDGSTDWYDSQEWLFIDLRLALAGDRALGDRATAIALAHLGIIPELVSAADGVEVTGAMPMVGFGAGAYALWLADRGKVGTWLYPPAGADGGPGADAGLDGGSGGGADGGADGGGGEPVADAGLSPDAGTAGPVLGPGATPLPCGCGGGPAASLAVLALAGFSALPRRRPSR